MWANCSMAIITVKEALNIIKSDAAFSIQFVTADLQRKKGGNRIKSDDAVGLGPKDRQNKNGTVNIKLRDHNNKIVTVHTKLIEYINNSQVLC
jgi:hypothetical protein